jgi:hypothetical protein
MAKIKNLIKGLQIFEKYFETDSDVYDVSSIEDETMICVSCKTSEDDHVKLVDLGWDDEYDETEDGATIWVCWNN